MARWSVCVRRIIFLLITSQNEICIDWGGALRSRSMDKLKSHHLVSECCLSERKWCYFIAIPSGKTSVLLLQVICGFEMQRKSIKAVGSQFRSFPN